MVTIQRKTVFLCACFLEAFWLLLAQTLGSTMLLLPCLVCFLALVVWAAVQDMAMPVLLFFLPFAALLKVAPGTISFYTLALLVVYGVCVVLKSRQVPIVHLIPALLLIAQTLIVKVSYGYSFSNSYILFCATLLLIPFIKQALDGAYDYYWLTLCFTLGVVLAAITSQYLTVYPSIAQYIETIDMVSYTRHSGYYGDPNFYSAIITTAMSGILVLLSNQGKKSRAIALVLTVLLLVYCGLLSVSKTFLLVAVCLFLFWGADLMFQKGKLSAKLTMIVITIVAICFLLSSTVFTDLIDVALSRFSRDANLSDFTTGRTDLWLNYLRALGSDPKLLLFGSGYTKVEVGGRASHNTIIQMVYQFGLVGSVFLVSWIVCFVRTLLADMRRSRVRLAQVAILLLGAFGPWIALDYLFFDEFFLFIVYVCIALRYLVDQSMATESLMEGNE